MGIPYHNMSHNISFATQQSFFSLFKWIPHQVRDDTTSADSFTLIPGPSATRIVYKAIHISPTHGGENPIRR